MTYEEAISELKDNKIIGRSNWDGKFVRCKNKEFEVITQKQPESISEQWLPGNEDIWADDWILIDPNDIKRFHLSVNQLKTLGVSQEAINELKKPDTLPNSTEQPSNVQKIVDKLFGGDSTKIKLNLSPEDILKNIQNNIQVPTFEQPQFPQIRK
ncbi:Thoeris anti-defense Tad2 family protein [Desulforamulus aeronauticus]|nr:MW1434 family type I TA system toxin [Desulforamulus aeronauticus]